MGEHEGWPQPSGLLPNGLLPNVSTSVIRVLDSKRWSMAEERTAELITCIQPNKPSEERRNAVAEYVQQLIMKWFPCQKVPIRDQHASGTRRNSYNNYDRSNHADREGNWNAAKARAAARNHSRYQAEKSRVDRLAPSENRADRPWVRHEPLSSYQAQNGPVQPDSSQSGSAPMAYGMYQLPGMNSSGVMSNGPAVPSIVMLYSYGHNSGYVSPDEQLEFGSLGPVGLVVMNDAAQPGDGTRVRGPFVEQRHHGNSIQRSSPDQPTSPHFQRSLAQGNYQLKDEDFPPLIFPNQGADDRTYGKKEETGISRSENSPFQECCNGVGRGKEEEAFDSQNILGSDTMQLSQSSSHS